MGKLHILLLGLYEHDAIGNFTLAIASHIRESGKKCAIYAQDHSASLHVDGTYEDFFSVVQPKDILLYTFSNVDPQLPRIMEAPCRRVIYYHNITPGHFFRPYDAGIADMLDRGRSLFPLVSQAHAVFANSAWSLRELMPYIAPDARYGVMPPLTKAMFERFENMGTSTTTPEWLPMPYILTMGRLVPHKNIIWGLKQFSALHAHMPQLSYAIVGGDGGMGAYAQEVVRLASTLGDAQRKVHFIGDVSDEDALAWLGNAHALLCVSQHEGFGVPLVEAMLRGVPVMALSQPAVNETLGAAALILESQDVEHNAERMESFLLNQKKIAKLKGMQYERCKVIKLLSVDNIFWEVLMS